MYFNKETKKLEFRYPTFKERLIDFSQKLLGWIIFPFYWAVIYIGRFFRCVFIERIYTGDNGIIGPGYQTYYTSRFAWGRLAFILVVLFVIVYVISELFL